MLLTDKQIRILYRCRNGHLVQQNVYGRGGMDAKESKVATKTLLINALLHALLSQISVNRKRVNMP